MNTNFYRFCGYEKEDYVGDFPEPFLVCLESGRRGMVVVECYQPKINYVSASNPLKNLECIECVGGMYLEHPVIGDALVVDTEIDGVDWKDAPDFSDAHYSRAVWAHSGEDLTEDQLDQLGEKYADQLNESARSSR